MKNVPKFLHIGCGKKRKLETPFAETNWQEIRLDISPTFHPDLIGSMTEMNAVKDSSVDAIFSSHNIEHLLPHEVPLALQEFKRVLKPEGFALITCPDLQSVCEVVAKDQLTDPIFMTSSGPIAAIDIIFGHRPALQRGELHMAHRCGFTAKSMGNSLAIEGFTSITTRVVGDLNLWTIAGINQKKSWLTNKALTFFPPNHRSCCEQQVNEPQ